MRGRAFHPARRAADERVVSRAVPQLLLAALALVLLAGAARADGDDAFLLPGELRGGWEVLREAPSDPASDPDLVAWGVRDQRVRHYTRDHRRRVEVCSVEIWDFASEPQAAAAESGFEYPGWQIRRAGERLVMVRGLVLTPEGAARRGVFPECGSLGGRILDRVRRAAPAGSP